MLSLSSKALPCGYARMLPQFASQQNLTAQLRSVIQAHRNTWITEDDFAFMASIGVNSVRLPIGYWVLAQSQVPQEALAAARPTCCSIPPTCWHGAMTVGETDSNLLPDISCRS